MIAASNNGIFSMWMKDEDTENVSTSEEDY